MAVARAPDDILHFQRAFVGEQWQSIAHTDNPGNTLHSGIDEILRFYAHKRSRARNHPRTQLTADRCLYSKDVMTQESHQTHQDGGRKERINAPGNMS